MLISLILFILFSAGFLIFPNLNSDTLYMEVFQNSFFRDIGQGDIWLQMPASAYFPDQIVYFLSRKLLNINQTLFIVALTKIFLLITSISYFCKNIYETSTKKSFFLGIIVSSIFVPTYKALHFSIFRIEFNHFAPVIFILIILPSLLKLKNSNNILVYISLFLSSFVSTLSSVVTIVILFSYTLSIFLEEFKIKKFIYSFISQEKLLRMIFVIYSGLFTGYLTYTRVINLNYFSDRTFQSNQSLIFLKNIGSNIPISIYITIPIVFLALIYGSIAFNNKNLPSNIIKLNSINIKATFIAAFAYLFLGALVERGFYRYFYPFIIIYLINLVYAVSINREKLFKYSKYIFLISLLFPNFKYFDKSFFKNFKNSSLDEAIISKCVNKFVNLNVNDQRVGVGILNYWDSNYNSVRTYDKRIDYVELSPDGSPRLWMQNLATKNSKYDNFYLVFKKDQKFLLPFETYLLNECEDKNTAIYSFKQGSKEFIDYYKSLSEFYWSLLFNTKEKIIYWGSNLPSTSKSLRENRMLLASDFGWAHYGPYINLKPGEYNVNLFYSFNSEKDNNIPSVEVGCITRNDEFYQISQKKLIRGNGIMENLIVNISRNDNCGKGYEVRTFLQNGQKMFINYLVIEKKF